jgi:hypothetical protein
VKKINGMKVGVRTLLGILMLSIASIAVTNAVAAEDADSQYRLGMTYFSGQGVEKDYVKAFELFQKSAVQGNAAAQGNLGLMYENGLGVTPDNAKAIEWYQKSAAQGTTAQYFLGLMYYKGKGVTQDYAKAFEWIQKSAAQEYTDAQYVLGFMYQQGQGVNQDYEKAIEWYQRSALQGNANAQNSLGVLYEHRPNVIPQPLIAFEWYQKAAAQGLPAAQENLNHLSLNFKRTHKGNDIAQVAAMAQADAEKKRALEQSNQSITFKVYEDNPNRNTSLGVPILLKLSSAGKVAGISTQNGGLFVVELRTGKQLFFTKNPTSQISAIEFNSDATTMAYVADNKVSLVDLTSGKLITNSKNIISKYIMPDTLAFSPDGKHLLVNNCGGMKKHDKYFVGLCVLDVPSLQIKWSQADSAIDKKIPGNASFAWMSGGKRFVTCGYGAASEGCKIINADSYSVNRNIKGNSVFSPSSPFAITPDEKKIISLANGTNLSAWSIETGELLFGANMNVPAGGVTLSDASWISVTSDGKRISLLGTQDPLVVKSIRLDNFGVLMETKLNPEAIQYEFERGNSSGYLDIDTNRQINVSPTGETYAYLLVSGHESYFEYFVRWRDMPK